MMQPSDKKERFSEAHRVAYAALACVGCAVLYFAVLQAFLEIPLFNTDTQVRPASGLGPVLGLFFGVPGILGCAVGNLASDMLYESDPVLLAAYFAIQIAYNAVPYLIWYVVMRKSEHPFPRLDSSANVALFMALALLDAIVVSVLLVPFELDTMVAFDIHLIRWLNNVIFLVYLGIPTLIVLDRLPFTPLAPPWIRLRYRQRKTMNLSQRTTFAVTFGAACAILVLVGLTYAPRFFEPDADFAQLIGSIYIMAAVLTATVFAPLLCVVHALEKRFTRPIEVLTEASRTFVEQVAAHDPSRGSLAVSDVDLKGTAPRHEMRDLFASTNKMRADLARYIGELSEATAERERAAAELDIASTIQNGAVPHDFSYFSERYQLDVAGVMRTAKEVGGDFYDVFDAGPHAVGFVIADVSGKGVPAALFMMRALTEIREQILHRGDVGSAFTLANRALCDHNEAALFVTAFACILDTETGTVTYANAGHNPPWLRRGVRGGWLDVAPEFVMGALDTVSYASATVDLSPGDGLLMYTDGVTEAVDAKQELFGTRRFEDVLHAAAGADAEAAIAQAVEAVDRFADGVDQADDISLLAFSWNLPVVSTEFPPDDRYLDDLFAFLKPLTERADCTDRMYLDLMLISEEVFVNIAHYGFPEGQPIQPVKVEAAIDERARCLHLTISDGGIAYNPLSFQPEKVGMGSDDRIGGLGILLVKERADDVRYERTGGMNVLHIVKKFV